MLFHLEARYLTLPKEAASKYNTSRSRAIICLEDYVRSTVPAELFNSLHPGV